MSRCTAPVYGHRSASAAADCPACGGRNRGYNSYSSYSSPYSSSAYTSSSRSGGSGSGRSAKPRWSRPGSSIMYTNEEVRTLTPVRENIEKRSSIP
ncbi:hypothetical protein OQ267_21785, partial [Pedobacter sp. MR22-3]